MAEKFLQSRLYEYAANSNLVLESDRDRRRSDEPKGEVETLRGRVHKIKMGERLGSKNNTTIDPELQQAKRQKLTVEVSEKSHTKKSDQLFGNKSILSSAEEMSSYNYIPKSAETVAAYEELLLFTQSQIGDQPSEVLKSAANEILTILKDGHHDNTYKQKEISKLLSTNIQNFGDLLRVSNRITDYKNFANLEEQDAQPIEEEMAVVFDDEDDEKYEEDEDDDDEEEEAETTKGPLRGGLGDEYDQQSADKYSDLSIHDIDAYWLQRQLSKYYSDANTSSKLAEETLNILANTDERVCENKLVFLLEFDKFDLIKKLLKHRAKIYYCIRLKQAQNEQDKQKIEQEMENDNQHGGQEILRLLSEKSSAQTWTQDRLGEIAMKAKKEALALKNSNEEGRTITHSSTIQEELDPKNSSLPSNINFEKNINLSDFIFPEGNHLMTNTRCELPEKSWRAQKKGYEEVHIPAMKPVIASEDSLRQIASLPSWMHDVFKGVKHLNRVQTKIADFALKEKDNLLLCAPTGSGKTIVALLCMLGLISNYRDEETGKINLNEFKIVYIAPMKALVQECVQSFSKRLECFGMNVKELSGDQSLSQQQINETHVIVTTPEKWDIVTRKAGDRTYTKLVKLVIIDEIHLLHDDRGPVLEAIVARIQRYVESGQNSVRIAGLSATLPNYEDVAAFLRIKPNHGLFFFDSSYRPVPLQQQFIGVTERKAVKRVQLQNEICYEKVLLHAGKNQVLIFTHSRADTVKTARALVEMATANDTLGRFLQEGSASAEILRTEIETVKNPDLRELLKYGFAVHHAGLVKGDRSLVEDLFADKHIQVLVSTATLAWGVNLPCHSVIIKGTQMYSPEKGGWTELSPLDILQMMGRAGRYGLDSEGEGIILTNHSELQYYLSLMNQQLPIESQLIKKLPECLNSEIVLGTVNNLMEAASWIGYTFLYIRMLRRPSLYGAQDIDPEQDPTYLKRRLELAYAAINVLEKHDLVKFDRKSGMLQSTDLGRIASYYYISNESIATYTDLMRPSMTEIDILRVFSLSSEFKFMRVREEEKLELSKLLQRVPIPIKESVEEASAKVNVLIQSYISRLKLEGFAISADMIFIQQSACRLLRALYEISLRKGWGLLSNKLLDLCIMTERRLWKSQSPLRQFTSIPEIIVRKLEKISDISWEKYLVLKPQDFGEMVKVPKMGKTIHKFVHTIPKLNIDIQAYPISRSILHIDAHLKSDFEFNDVIHGHQLLFWLRIEDGNGEKILHHEPIIVTQTARNKVGSSSWEHTASFTIPLLDPLPPQYFLRIVSDRWLHSNTVIPINFQHLTLPTKFHPPTEILDLSLFPIQSFHNQKIEEFFSPIDTLNSIQTQTYYSLYENHENVVICASQGSGKTICAELALLRFLLKENKEIHNDSGKCLYICPNLESCRILFKKWYLKFPSLFDKEVIILTGDLNRDQLLVKNYDIILATPEIWSNVSRKWKNKKYLFQIALYIFDDLHMIGQSNYTTDHHQGNIYESIITRARFMASQLEDSSSVRFIGLSHSVANASDIGSWLGATAANIFNFQADYHVGPLHFHLQTIDNYELHHRLQAMSKPVYDHIVKYSDHNLTIVFVPSRKQAQITSIDLIGYANALGNRNKYRFSYQNIPQEQLDYFQQQDSLLGTIMADGIAYIHEGFTEKEINSMQSLCEKQMINVLLVPYTMAYHLQIQAHLVVIMDTLIFDGVNGQYIDLPPHYLWSMIAKADVHSDYESYVSIFCSIYKKEQLKRNLFESFPLESYLSKHMKDLITEESSNSTIESLTDAVDYLTWTLYYHRLAQNPNFYALAGTSLRHISDHFSELVENSVTELQESKILSLEDEINIVPLNLGMVSSFYGLSSLTIEMMSTAITEKTKIRGIIDIITTASEFHSLLYLRFGELNLLNKLIHSTDLRSYNLTTSANSSSSSSSSSDVTENLIKFKVMSLLYAYMMRIPLNYEWIYDLKFLLSQSITLIHALIDVIASQGYLKSVLSAMELSQLLIQGLNENDSLFLQIPHFTKEFITNHLSGRNNKYSIETIFDITDLEDEQRSDLFQSFNKRQLLEIASFCNAYPYLEVSYQLSCAIEQDGNDAGDEEEKATRGEVTAGDAVTVMVQILRDVDEEDMTKIGLVSSKYYPNEKYENWWVMVGDVKGNNLYAIKKLTILKKATAKLEFFAPQVPGDYDLKIYVMCDSYVGCDQEYEFSMTVLPSDDIEEMEE